MTREEIEFLLNAARTAQLPLVEFERGGTTLRVRFDPVEAATRSGPQTIDSGAVSVEAGKVVKSPQMGIFTIDHPMTSGLVTPQERQVAEGEIVGFISVRNAVAPVVAPSAGTIRPTRQSGAVVGFGDILYEYLPTGL